VTQILAALTHDYVLVASDRRLTFASGPRNGQVADDDTCKLVCLCGIWGIAYTGLATLDGMPTHEWIAVRLAENKCVSPYSAAQILGDAAAPALRAAGISLELTFLIAGWARLPDLTLVPHFLLISNMHEAVGQLRAAPGQSFNRFERRLRSDEAYAARVVGQPLPNGRGKQLDRLLRRMLKHKVGPKPAMQAFAREILRTSEVRNSVGEKVLAFSIPIAAARQTYKTRNQMMLAMEPNLSNAAFCYFDPAYSQLRQYGPTFTCGESAVTDVETENDPARDFQSSSMRILHMRKPS